MALFRYFKRDSAGTFLPDLKGPLSTSLSTGNIKAANKAVPCDGRGQKAHVFLKLLISKIILKPIPIFFENLHFRKFPVIWYNSHPCCIVINNTIIIICYAIYFHSNDITIHNT